MVCSSLPTEGKASVANEEYLAIDKVEGVDNVYVVTMTGIADGVTILTSLDTVRVLLDVLEEITLGIATIDA